MATITQTGNRNWLAAARRVIDSCWFGTSNSAEQMPLALNNENILAVNAAGTGTVGLIKANASDIPQLGDGAVIGTPGTGSTAIVTVGGTQTLTGKTLAGGINGDITRCSAQIDATTNTTLANVTGLVATVVPGTYRFHCVLPGTAGASGGVKYAFKLTTTVLTSIEATGLAYAAAAVAVQHTTTTTDQTSLVSSTSAAIFSVIEGSMVVGTGGTIQLQFAQNASNGTTSSVYVGATMSFTRIA